MFSLSFSLGAILFVLHLLEYVRKTYFPKPRKSRKILNEFIISFFLLSLVIIPPLSSQAVQKMLMQDPYFVIFAKEDGNSKLLVNLVHLSPFNDIKEMMFNEWTEVSQNIHTVIKSYFLQQIVTCSSFKTQKRSTSTIYLADLQEIECLTSLTNLSTISQIKSDDVLIILDTGTLSLIIFVSKYS